jgi:hypothetical protein
MPHITDARFTKRKIPASFLILPTAFTDQMASLGEKTVESLLVLKLRPGHPCGASRQHSNKTLDKLKGAYYRQLKQ